MPETDLNYRNLLVVLIWEKKTLSEVLKGQDRYSELLEELNKHDIDDYGPLPKQKDLLKVLGMKREQLITLMREMYEEFCSKISRDGNYPIKKTEIYICASNINDNYWVLSPNQLRFLPNIGDTIQIPFFRDNVISRGYFKVQQVNHEIESQKYTITLFVDDDINSKFN